MDATEDKSGEGKAESDLTGSDVIPVTDAQQPESGTPVDITGSDVIPVTDSEEIESGTPVTVTGNDVIPVTDSQQIESGTPVTVTGSDIIPVTDSQQIESGTPVTVTGSDVIPVTDSQQIESGTPVDVIGSEVSQEMADLQETETGSELITEVADSQQTGQEIIATVSDVIQEITDLQQTGPEIHAPGSDVIQELKQTEPYEPRSLQSEEKTVESSLRDLIGQFLTMESEIIPSEEFHSFPPDSQTGNMIIGQTSMDDFVIDTEGQGQNVVVVEDVLGDVVQDKTSIPSHLSNIFQDSTRVSQDPTQVSQDSEEEHIESVSDEEADHDEDFASFGDDTASSNYLLIPASRQNLLSPKSNGDTDELIQSYHDDGESSIVSDCFTDVSNIKTQSSPIWTSRSIQRPTRGRQLYCKPQMASKIYSQRAHSVPRPASQSQQAIIVTRSPIGYYLDDEEAKVSVT